MKKMKMLVLAIICLLTACGMPETAPHGAMGKTVSDSAAIFQNRAYEEMFNGSLAKAEAYAYRAYLMSTNRLIQNTCYLIDCPMTMSCRGTLSQEKRAISSLAFIG